MSGHPPHKLSELRTKHPRFRYKSFTYVAREDSLELTFDFLLEPDILFRPQIRIPYKNDIDPRLLDTMCFHIGLVEMISYWKAACSPEIIVEAGSLSPEQITWWHDLFIHGLGEFYFLNQIDFTSENFLKIQSSGSSEKEFDAPKTSGMLILASGGKDSIVSLELLKETELRKEVFALNPTPATLESLQVAGYPPPLTAHRQIDQKLLSLNTAGYLNGHTPFSALLAFLSSTVASLHGLSYVLASNEHSASEANTEYLGLEVNHQYSKSYRFEERFRAYARKWLSPTTEYFSFLRPILDIQIGKLFAKNNEQHKVFRSCNVGQKENIWCGSCPKCAFVYLCICPFLSNEQAHEIFGPGWEENKAFQTHARGLFGLARTKPFECVGTTEESLLALELLKKRYADEGKTPPSFLLDVSRELEAKGILSPQPEMLQHWHPEHFLPEDFEALLRRAVQG